MNAIPEEKRMHSMLNGVDIPPCPVVLLELDAELKKDVPDQREVGRLISSDVALSGHVMLVANSPAFSTGHKLPTVMQAINVLGMRSVFNMVVGHLLKAALSDGQDLTMERFWESSALTARVSAELAKRLRCVRPDVAYTFGLFHDCGIPLLMKRFPQTKEVLAKANASEERIFTEIEEEGLGTNHAVVGYFLVKRWHLPDFIAEGVLYHHDYGVFGKPGSVADVSCALIAINVLAEHVTRLHNAGRGEEEWTKAAESVCAYFNLSLGAVDDLIDDLLDWLS
ncbi:HDOD domain-containing protein [Dechloromonas sp. XY25]|uniref:HDOD domain-containing protein n=1 Tax=Dechloromonas hankyongensis TaxID=2908002 RepID=A0ABS9K4X3_9RHOO|nr:HDOD domain-containing protein [Dechloromonas hankyongensis]MCG2578208.1 HDOD domain-containing protein [Dechloromonas hankyongensis]